MLSHYHYQQHQQQQQQQQQPRTAENKVIFQSDSCFSDSIERIIVVEDLDKLDPDSSENDDITEDVHHETSSPPDSETERFTPSPQEIEIDLPDSSPFEKRDNNDVTKTEKCVVTENETSHSDVTKRDAVEDDFVRIQSSRYDFIKSVTSKYDVILSEDLDCDSPNDQSITVELPSQQQQHVNLSPEDSPEPSPSPPQMSRFQQVESRFEIHQHFSGNCTLKEDHTFTLF